MSILLLLHTRSIVESVFTSFWLTGHVYWVAKDGKLASSRHSMRMYSFPLFRSQPVGPSKAWEMWHVTLNRHFIHDYQVFMGATVEEPMRVVCQSQEVATVGSSVLYVDGDGATQRGFLLRLLKLSPPQHFGSDLATLSWALISPYVNTKRTDAFCHNVLELADVYVLLPARCIVQPFHAVHYCPSNPFCLGKTNGVNLPSTVAGPILPGCNPNLFSVNQFRITDPLHASPFLDPQFNPVSPFQFSAKQASRLIE